MNRLQFETSPYLLQHAHNPVDWYPWKAEALERAKAENKPILLSIGYSTCHWCHVMERESFEDPDIAELMNTHFINIKLDREERPDLDHIYMEACQVFTGSGGWPLNCFLLPDGRPYFLGTYFPPVPAHQRPSWRQVLLSMADAFRTKYAAVEQQAERITESIARSSTFHFDATVAAGDPEKIFTPVYPYQAFHQLSTRFDRQDGGFGGAPKFPGAMSLQFLLEYHYYTGDAAALEHVNFSLEKMIRGGIYDQLGGGFARYATDKAWLVPHFEKMLYDNALLVGLLADAYRQTQLPLYRQTIEQTLTFIERELRDEAGGFYSALDADSEGEEGKFYVWSAEEIAAALPNAARYAQFAARYGVEPAGNWEGVNILWQAQTLAEVAATTGKDLAQLAAELEEDAQTLLDLRAQRPRPGLDDKILLGWNALMVTAYAKAYQALGHSHYREVAIAALDFLLDKFAGATGGKFFHTYKRVNGVDQAQVNAFLDDYAYLIEALLEVGTIALDDRYFRKAADLAEFTREHFLDADGKLFYFTDADQTDVLMRGTELYDNAVPSGNSTMVRNLLRLGIIGDRPDFTELAFNTLQPLAASIEKYPNAFARWASAVLAVVYGQAEVAVVGPEATTLAAEFQRVYVPNAIVLAAAEPTEAQPLLAGKIVPAGQTQIFICRNYACQLPVDTVAAALELLKK